MIPIVTCGHRFITLQPELWERLACGCGQVCDCVCGEHSFDGEAQVCITHIE